MHEGAESFSHDVGWRLHLPDGEGPWPLVVALHGMGQSAELLDKVLAPLPRDRFALLIPDGPLPYEIREADGIREGRAWYIYTGDQDAFLESADATTAWLLGLVGRIAAAHPVDADRLALFGYSQGGYLAGMAAIRNSDRVAALVSACSRIKSELLDRVEVGRRFPVLVVHGERDRSLAVDRSRASAQTLREHGFDVDFREYPSGHRLTEEQIADIADFLGRALEG